MYVYTVYTHLNNDVIKLGTAVTISVLRCVVTS